MSEYVSVLVTCTRKLIWIVVSCDSKLCDGRRAVYGKCGFLHVSSNSLSVMML